MLKRSIAIALACALLFQVYGCSTIRKIPLEHGDVYLRGREIFIQMLDGNRLSLDMYGAQIVSDTLHVFGGSLPVSIAVSGIRELSIKQVDPQKTVLITLPIVGFFVWYFTSPNSIGNLKK
ncbi:hypothetical protein ACFL3H_07365 [Gemmatimonadota bacterium]